MNSKTDHADQQSQRRTTPLAKCLKKRIAHDGPISICDYIQACLQDPTHGYYRHQTAIGAAGDFVTAPEISQIFGELIGLWSAVTWQQMGQPEAIQIIELGPGRATLIKDALRASKRVPGFHKALNIVLVETNETLIALQKKTLADVAIKQSWDPSFSKATQKAIPTIVIANEFIDTLPVRQYVRQNDKWFERAVICDDNTDLQFGHMPTGPTDLQNIVRENPAQKEVVASVKNGDTIEIRQSIEQLTGPLSTLSHAHAPMAALFIDYGHPKPGLNDTLQAVRNHHHEHPLRSPGEADLTTQVDFSQIAHALKMSALSPVGPIPQMTFLGQLGIMERASKLMAANPQHAGDIESSVARLTAPNGMGGRFHVLGVTSNFPETLAGF